MSAGLVYLPGVATLALDPAACTGCGTCLIVCPHAVFAPLERAVRIQAIDRCIECGACARNCPAGAVTVHPGTGCALAILKSWVRRGGTPSCGDATERDGDGCSPSAGPGGRSPAAGGAPC